MAKMFHTNLVKRLWFLGLVDSTGGRALDLGCGNGDVALDLAALDYEVDVVDKKEEQIASLKKSKKEHINYFNELVETFKITPGTYTIIIANNVLPFIENRETVRGTITKVAQGLVPEGVMYITLFGPNDEWGNREGMSFFAYEEAVAMIDILPLQSFYQSTEEGYGRKLDGTLKWWHIHTFILKN